MKSSQKSHCDPPKTLEEFLERQWVQSSQFLLEQSQFFDISSLISSLYQLKSENRFLDEKLKGLTQRRDHLIAVNSILSMPLSSAALPNSLDNLNQLAIATANSSTLNTPSNDQTSATNLFFSNQNALNQQQNFSSIHNNTTATSTPSPNTNSQQKSHSQSNHSNFFNLNHVNNLNGSLNNQTYNNKSIDLNSNLSNSFLELNNQLSNSTSTNNSSNLKQQTNNFSFNNGLFQAVNGQFNNSLTGLNNTTTSSPSKLNQFNGSLTNSANNNLLQSQIFQNIYQNSQAFGNKR